MAGAHGAFRLNGLGQLELIEDIADMNSYLADICPDAEETSVSVTSLHYHLRLLRSFAAGFGDVVYGERKAIKQPEAIIVY